MQAACHLAWCLHNRLQAMIFVADGLVVKAPASSAVYLPPCLQVCVLMLVPS